MRPTSRPPPLNLLSPLLSTPSQATDLRRAAASPTPSRAGDDLVRGAKREGRGATPP